jgi:hypothetical protein
MTIDKPNQKNNLGTTAQIIAFPGPKQVQSAGSNHRAAPVSALNAQQELTTVHGSSWYHEVAVSEAEIIPK